MAAMKRDQEYPYCFGKLDLVFPMGKDGLRHTPESCTPCIYKTECLRSAVAETGGLEIREEKVDRAYSAGLIGFFERWSRKKEIERKRKEGGADRKKTKKLNSST
jgi:hypothetical protein